ncbi:hypothetical protein DSO57_1019878 [Entomophthora muscae]|uniref:Uncharacterized protein n=2 Tax=Entomophthora muscae TaxID=34485 RepID=A0ACC2T0U5_9FUNG|nr:hypothetical protein DSO57_1031421 [Entomophthora muscae]KAJ9080909.1 hypothetical protein DSO57_1019878 [Entomophthora muscae]
MTKTYSGAFVMCDPTVKQILLELNERHNFILFDLDDSHLFVKPDMVRYIKNEVQKVLDENAFKLDIDVPNNPGV